MFPEQENIFINICINPPALTGGFISNLIYFFMRNYQRYILYGGIATVIVVLFFTFLVNKKEIPLVVPSDKNYTEEKITPKQEVNIKFSNVSKINQEEKDSSQIKFTVLVNDNKYESNVLDGATAFEAMDKLSKDNKNFSFKYTEHGGMGNFITEINGEKGTPGKYWIYYVNGDKPSVGASKYILKDGDIIKWSQEGI